MISAALSDQSSGYTGMGIPRHTALGVSAEAPGICCFCKRQQFNKVKRFSLVKERWTEDKLRGCAPKGLCQGPVDKQELFPTET